MNVSGKSNEDDSIIDALKSFGTAPQVGTKKYIGRDSLGRSVSNASKDNKMSLGGIFERVDNVIKQDKWRGYTKEDIQQAAEGLKKIKATATQKDSRKFSREIEQADQLINQLKSKAQNLTPPSTPPRSRATTPEPRPTTPLNPIILDSRDDALFALSELPIGTNAFWRDDKGINFLYKLSNEEFSKPVIFNTEREITQEKINELKNPSSRTSSPPPKAGPQSPTIKPQKVEATVIKDPKIEVRNALKLTIDEYFKSTGTKPISFSVNDIDKIIKKLYYKTQPDVAGWSRSISKTNEEREKNTEEYVNLKRIYESKQGEYSKLTGEVLLAKFKKDFGIV
ncbi:MAG: hypothetical protein H0W88_05410 [Parachlamydiaceae bacterium]|nr:hypothetical protein [Parachlamydiaceae bacterium]